MSATSTEPEQITLDVGQDRHVSALLVCPAQPSACIVLAHGAGAGMHHPFMAATAAALAQQQIASLRYQFPYMEKGAKRPDPAPLCHATVRAAVEAAHTRLPMLPLFAGGKSFGGRMTSQAQAARALPHVRGIAFLGFPLHPPKQPGDERAQHLSSIRIPMLFLQGSRDEFASLDLLRAVVERLGAQATLALIEGADHSFHVPARSGSNDSQVLLQAVETLARWMALNARS